MALVALKVLMRKAKTSQLKRPKVAMPAFVRNALSERGLMEAYQVRPPYQRNDYLSWISQAKLQATKAKRLQQMLNELKGGTRYMNMAWRSRDAASD
jgi:uncharacterized protein YdeI (YjbR/CyaY-like superfamily)